MKLRCKGKFHDRKNILLSHIYIADKINSDFLLKLDNSIQKIFLSDYEPEWGERSDTSEAGNQASIISSKFIYHRKRKTCREYIIETI